jgi:hypothetical protein
MTQPGDLTVVQAGALNLTELVILGGGSVAIEADGNITIGTITGVAGDIKLTSKTGGISIASLSAAGDVVLSAVAGAIASAPNPSAQMRAPLLANRFIAVSPLFPGAFALDVESSVSRTSAAPASPANRGDCRNARWTARPSRSNLSPITKSHGRGA